MGSGNVKKLEALEQKHKSAETEIANLKSQIQGLQDQSPDNLLKTANEGLLSQVENLDLQVSELTQVAKDATTQCASDTASMKAEISALKSQLTKARQQSEVQELRMTLPSLGTRTLRHNKKPRQQM